MTFTAMFCEHCACRHAEQVFITPKSERNRILRTTQKHSQPRDRKTEKSTWALSCPRIAPRSGKLAIPYQLQVIALRPSHPSLPIAHYTSPENVHQALLQDDSGSKARIRFRVQSRFILVTLIAKGLRAISFFVRAHWQPCTTKASAPANPSLWAPAPVPFERARALGGT